MAALGKFLDHFFVECGYVVRIAARDEAVVDNAGFIDPLSTGVDEVGFHGRPGSYLSPANDVGLNERPWSVAYDRDRLASVEKAFYEFHRLGLHPKLIGVCHASRQQQCVEIINLRILKLNVDGKL